MLGQDSLKYSAEHNKQKQCLVSVGRRFGKTGLLYHSIVNSLPVPDEKKKELHEQYEKALRGEE